MTARPLQPFVNAQDMHRRNPDTFDAPSETDLAAITPGDSVMVCTGDERFWVTVTEAGDATLSGTVDNELISTDDHGLRYGDAIGFPKDCVYDIMLACEAEASDTVTLDQIMPHTDLGNVKLSRVGLKAFHAARDARACTEYAIAAYLKAAGA